MINTLKNIFNIGASTNVNGLIYFLQKLPFVGKLFKDSLYSKIDIKKKLGIIAIIIKIIGKFGGKFIYVGLMIFLPTHLFMGEYPNLSGIDVFTNIFFFLSFIVGAFVNIDILSTNRDKFISVKLMGMNPRNYSVATTCVKYVCFFIYFIPPVTLFSTLLGAPLWWGVIFSLILTLWKIACVALHLFLFDKFDFVLPKSNVAIGLGILIGIGAAYGLPFTQYLILKEYIVINIFTCLIVIGLGVLCSFYILNYKKYRDVIDVSTKADDPLFNIGQVQAEAKFADVKIKDKDFSNESLAIDKYESKKGYDYLNAIFFDRHRRLLIKPVKTRLAIIALATIGIIVAIFFSKKMAESVNDVFTSSLPTFVFLMYVTSIGERICRAMFYNCDISLLRYGFYRKRNVILKNFKVRLLRVSAMNLIPAIAICFGLTALVLVSKAEIQLAQIIPYFLSIISLSLFFSVHHLCMYYIFQPYTTELDIKNPFFKIINSVVYLLCFACLQIKTAPSYFTILVLFATVVYMIIALILVYKFADKTFRVK